MTLRNVVILVAAGGCLTISSLAFGATPSQPATLAVTHSAEMGALSEKSWDNSVRWQQLAITRDGRLVFFYCDPQRKVVYQLSRDGREFEPPVEIASGFTPAVATDAEDNIYLAYKLPNKRVAVKKLARRDDGQWDLSSEEVLPLAKQGMGVDGFPSLLILPGSSRIWCLVNYQPADIFSLPKTEEYARRKPRGHAVVTYSDDGGATWAEGQYVGSDSGDEGSGIVVLRPWRGRAAWFWTFWDCATPAWGFEDGSRLRGLREFFPHSQSRMAVGHPWDAAEDGRGGLYFASSIKAPQWQRMYKYFDGSAWSEEVFLGAGGGAFVLLGDGAHTFAAVVERGRILLHELNGTSASARPDLAKPTEGKLFGKPFSLPAGRGAAGYIPLFVTEGLPKPVARRIDVKEQRIRYLRLEVKPFEASAGEAVSQPAPDQGDGAFKPMPLADERLEPRTDASKDRKIIRVGDRWALVYADDNPGRLTAAWIEGGKLGRPMTLIDKPDWNAYQCSAAAGDGVAIVTAPALPEPPKLSADQLSVGAVRPAPVERWPVPQWSTVCRTADGEVFTADVRDGALVAGLWSDGAGMHKAMASPTADPRPALVAAADGVCLLVGGRDGLWSVDWDRGKWQGRVQIVKDKWIGPHFSATADGDRIDVIYTPGESYLGRRVIGHVRRQGGQWKQMPDLDAGHVVRGLSLCETGGGRLLAAYCVRNDRPEMDKVAKGGERLKRFTYSLFYRRFDGEKWGEAAAVAWPDVPVYRPAEWKDWNDVGGVVYIPETDLGRFPTLPASSAGAKRVPLAWMVPGFHCLPKKQRPPPDRGGLLVCTEIPVE